MIQQTIKMFIEALLDTDRERALKEVHDALQKGLSPEEIVFDVVIPSIGIMVKSISENFDASLAQHFITSQIAAEVTEEMIPKFKKAKEVIGHVIIGTSTGDFHGLGKRIVIGCLKALTIDVTDLGLNVPAHRFVEQAIELNAQVIGISSMMVHTARGENGCLKVRKMLNEMGLEDKIKVVVGGAPYRYDPGLYKIVQADAWAENGISAGKVITDLIKEVKK
jgi:methylmalonyl-CoA mutase cobalamin-binding domain/chain